MANISRVDVNNIAATYLRDRVNGNFNPYRQGWYPNSVNTGLLDWFDNNPGEATPSNWLGNNVVGSTTRQLAINLGNYYSRVMYCRYGMTRTGYSDWGGNQVRALSSTAWVVQGYSFTISEATAQHYKNAVSSFTGIPAQYVLLQGWTPSTFYTGSRAGGPFYNVIDTRNNNLIGRVNFAMRSYYSDDVGEYDRYISKITWNSYSPNPIYYGWFAVNTAAAGAQAHRDIVASQAANAPALAGNVTTGSVASCYDYLWAVIWNNRHSHEVDLRVCHNSYVAPPHSSRGRR